MLIFFLSIRAVSIYGKPVPWQIRETPLRAVMSFLNLTKYPPSADFLLRTLGAGLLLFVGLERVPAA